MSSAMRTAPSSPPEAESTAAFVARRRPPRRAPRRDTGRARRGPFRPGQLIPSRARIEARILARTFRAVDFVAAAIFAVALTIEGHPPPPACGPRRC
jgi:hypothetical protein